MKRTVLIICLIIILTISLKMTSLFFSDFFAIPQVNKYGRIGRDTVLVIGNGKYQIVNSPKELNLIMYNNSNVTEVVMSDIKNYKKYNNKVFIVSLEGYSIIDETTNTCVTYIFVAQQKYGGAYVEDDMGNITFIPHEIKDESFIYLDTYDDFTKEEKEIFDEMSHN